MTDIEQHPVVSREDWLTARKAHLKNEKALTHLRDLVAAERRALPWVKVDKEYIFDTRDGKQTLADLFGGRSQLIVNHFMLGPDWEAGCPSCSLCADHAEGAIVHLENHDVAYVRVSRAPLARIEAYKKRMDWQAKWVSSYNNDFNFDYHVSFEQDAIDKSGMYYNYQTVDDPKYFFDELPGHSVFYRNDKDEVFHTYSSYARGNEEVIGTFVYLDMTPKGRNEKEIMDWVRRHDEYEGVAAPVAACHPS
ncbi:MAG: thioredoxin family protein [Cellvibrionaceae bacterium]